jgi:cobalamin biosynthesis Mg chelatase CobN
MPPTRGGQFTTKTFSGLLLARAKAAMAGGNGAAGLRAATAGAATAASPLARKADASTLACPKTISRSLSRSTSASDGNSQRSWAAAVEPTGAEPTGAEPTGASAPDGVGDRRTPQRTAWPRSRRESSPAVKGSNPRVLVLVVLVLVVLVVVVVVLVLVVLVSRRRARALGRALASSVQNSAP